MLEQSGPAGDVGESWKLWSGEPSMLSMVATWIWAPAIKVTENPADQGGSGENQGSLSARHTGARG